MTKTLLICFFLGSCTINVFSQDSSLYLKNGKNLKIGLYKEWDEFINNNPSITSPFYVVPQYRKKKWENDSVTSNNQRDTVIINYRYEFIDSNIKRKRVISFFDGERLFISDLLSEQLQLNLVKTQPFLPVDYIGRFPFIVVIRKQLHMGFDPISIIVGIADALSSHSKEEIWYFNKKGKFLQATPQAIAFLVKDDKDFVRAFSAEKEKTNAVLKKYLIKMNERYPL